MMIKRKYNCTRRHPMYSKAARAQRQRRNRENLQKINSYENSERIIPDVDVTPAPVPAAPAVDDAVENDCSSSSQDCEQLEVLVNPFEFYGTEPEDQRDTDMQNPGDNKECAAVVHKEPVQMTVREILVFKQNQIFVIPGLSFPHIIYPLQSVQVSEGKT